MDELAYKNTDIEVWREVPGDHYADSIHITEGNGIGINCGGNVMVLPVRSWHLAGQLIHAVDPSLASWKYKLAMWLLNRNSLDKNPLKL